MCIINFFTDAENSVVEQIESDRKYAEVLAVEDDDGDELELLKCSGISDLNSSRMEKLKWSSLHKALNKLSLNDVYQFATGLRYTPPSGCKGAVEFIHDALSGRRAKGST